MIQFEEFSFAYRGSSHKALDGLTLTIREGEFVGIIGNSGAGKSTLAYSLCGVIPHHLEGEFYGAVRVNGLDTVEVRPEELARYVGEVFQDIDSQMVSSVVEDEILFGMENFGIAHDEIGRRMDRVLSMMGIEDLRHRQISTLSGGQKQKVAIASILVLQPDIIVLDEPTGELDPESTIMIYDMLRTLNQQFGKTILVVEQKIMVLAEYTQRLLVLDQGSVVFDGATQEIGQQAELLKQLGINIPRVVELGLRLTEAGVYHGKLPLTIEDAEVMVREVLRNA